jgi:hypothetical protein
MIVLIKEWEPVLSISITFVSIVLAIYFYFRSKSIKIPVFSKESFNIIQDSISKLSDIKVSYKDEIINNLTITKIAFLNRGRETIDKTDIAEKDPLRITVKENLKILDAKIIYTSAKNDENVFCISNIEDNNSIKILFDFLDKDQGGIIQIAHTGTSSKDIAVTGKIKGVEKLIHRDVRGQMSKYDWINRLFLFVGGLLSIWAGIDLVLSHDKGGGIPIAFGIFLISSAYFFWKTRLPKGFELFQEDV